MHNKKPVQRILSLCLAIAIVLGIAIGTIVPAFAAPTKDMMVTDNAGMLTAEQESEIEDMLYAINQRTGVELAVYTIETLNGQDIETKANDLFRELGLGDSEKNNGLLLLIALNDRKFRLEVGYGLEGTIPDTKAAEIINTMTPYFKEGNYADGIKAAVSKTENVLNGEADTTTEKSSPTRGDVFSLIFAIFTESLVVGCIISAIHDGIKESRKRRARKSGEPYIDDDDDSNDSDDDNSSGGWGFFDIFSDDDSGSWGGGSSGGGGASGGW